MLKAVNMYKRAFRFGLGVLMGSAYSNNPQEDTT